LTENIAISESNLRISISEKNCILQFVRRKPIPLNNFTPLHLAVTKTTFHYFCQGPL